MDDRLPGFLRLGARMGLLVDQPETFSGNLGVHLGGRDRGVAEQLLHGPNVGAAVEHVGGARVPEDVRRQPGTEADLVSVTTDDPPRPLPRQATTAGVQEHRLGVAPTWPPLRRQRPATRWRQPRGEGFAGQTADRYHPLLGTFAIGA